MIAIVGASPPKRYDPSVAALIAHPGHRFAKYDEDGEHEAPVLPESIEAGDRRLAGGERVALDFHVQEKLRDARRPARPRAG